MLSDKDFDVVYFSEYFKNPISSKDQGLCIIFQRLEKVLNKHGYKARTLPVKSKLVQDGQLSLWCRDYMPVHTVRRDLLRFSYTPDYLKCKKYDGHQPDNKWVCEQLGIRVANMADEEDGLYMRVVLDGGNIARCGDKVVMTDKVFLENPHIDKEKLIRYLEGWFDASIIWLPYDRRDYLGHSDGILRHISGNKVVMSPYGTPESNKADRKFDKLYRQILQDNGFEVLSLDFSGIDEPSDRRWAYTNWLQLKGLIIIPTFKDCPLSNQRVYEQICQFTKRMKVNIEMVEADDLVKFGGAFNCASWTTTQQAITGEHYIRRGKI